MKASLAKKISEMLQAPSKITYPTWDALRRRKWPEADHQEYQSYVNNYNVASWNPENGVWQIEDREVGHV